MNGVIKIHIRMKGTGTWLPLPASKKEFQNALREINAPSPDSITIIHYDTDIAALPVELLTSADLDHVNYLAARLAVLDKKQLIMLDSIMKSTFRFTTVEQFIDFADNEDYFLFRPGVNNPAELGRYYIFDTGLCQMPDAWKGGIDLEKFGSHAAKQERGEFTSNGYLMLSGDGWQNRLVEQGIPDEYRLRGMED